MHKVCKKLSIVALGAAMALGAISFSGCSNRLAEDDYAGEVVSNGGFVVETDNYIYFINGVDDYTAENNGKVVKASLMRISTTDFETGNYGNTETVVPSLMVTSNYDAGVYIYGDRVYYATPTNAKNLDGAVENSYLDFKSTKLDGTDTTKNYYFRSSSNSAAYRYTEIDGVVYCLHVVGSADVYSYNTQTGEDTLIAKSTTSVLFDETTSASGRFYYTMAVTVDIDSENAYEESYNQIYTATADMKAESFDKKTASYTVNGKTYSFDKDFLEDYDLNSFDASDITTYPYVNLGELVLDGKGVANVDTAYNAEGECFTPSGYTYSLVQATNDGLYYSRSYVDATDSNGDGNWVFYLSREDFSSEGWNPIENNYHNAADEKNEIIAYDTTNASASAIFYKKNGVNYYLYLSGSAIYRNKVHENGSVAETVRIVNSASGATLLTVDTAGGFDYLYYSMPSGSGNALYRAVYSGTTDDYNVINKNKDYQPVQILDVEYASDWYQPEIIENKLVYVNAEAVGALSYNYVCVVDLNGANGLMTNSEISAFNDLYEDITTFISDMQESDADLGNLMYYYYYSDGFVFPYIDESDYGDYFDSDYLASWEGTPDFYHNILVVAANEGYSATYLYSALYQSEFELYLAHGEGTLGDYTFLDDNGEYYGFRNYFYDYMGEITEEDADAIVNVWKVGMVLTVEVDDSLAWWQWTLIGVAIALGVAAVACAVGIPLIIHFKRKRARLEAIKSAQPGVRHVDVDTTDDRTIDVYSGEAPSEENADENRDSTENKQEE